MAKSVWLSNLLQSGILTTNEIRDLDRRQVDITKIVDKYFRPFVASAAAIFLIPWVLYLELVLPTHCEAYHWRGAWAGST